MGRRKCTPKQLAALKRGREIAHRRSKKTTKGLFKTIQGAVKSAANTLAQKKARTLARGQARLNAAFGKTPIPAPVH